MTPSLAITIPTFNRADILIENLLHIFEELVFFNVKVYISDDSTDGKTEELFFKHFEKNPNFFYIRNIPSLGHDKNCVRTLQLAYEDYVWYLGDSMVIKKGAIETIVNILKSNKFDILCFNSESRSVELPSTHVFTFADEVLTKIAWHLTMSGVTIYSKKSLKYLNDDVSNYKNFPQLALIFLIFHYNFNTKLYWLNDKLIYGNKEKKSYWSGSVLNVFIYDLKNTLSRLPNNFSEEFIESTVKQHAVLSGVLSYVSFLVMRKDNNYNYNILKNNWAVYKKYTNNKYFLMLVISFFPKILLKIIKRFRDI